MGGGGWRTHLTLVSVENKVPHITAKLRHTPVYAAVKPALIAVQQSFSGLYICSMQYAQEYFLYSIEELSWFSLFGGPKGPRRIVDIPLELAWVCVNL